MGGPSKNLIEFAKYGAQTGEVELSIVTFQRGGTDKNEFVTAARSSGIEVHLLQEKRRFDLAPRQQLRQLIDRLKPDVLQSHNIKSHLLIRSLGLEEHYPWVAFQHGYTATNLKDRLYNHVDRWTLPAAHRVVTVCGVFAERLEHRGVSAQRIRIQHNAVRPFERPPEAEVAKIRDQWNLRGRLVILAVGRLSAEKGHADLLRAVAALSRVKTPDWRLLVAGDGPEMASLKAQAAELGIGSKVVFAGHQTDLRHYYAGADVLALPSHTEGSPNVVLEAMAAGVPIAACSVGGVPEIVTDGETGLLVPARQPERMAEALSRLVLNEDLRGRLGKAGQQKARQFTPEARFQSLLAIYRELLRSI